MPTKKPLVTAACLCEKVLNEADGVLSLIRVVDQYTVGASPDVVERLAPHLVVRLVLMLKGNGNVGKHQIGIQLVGPTNKAQETRTIEIEFPDKPLGGANVVLQVAIGVVKNFGESRFDVTFDGEFLTSVPFRVLQAPDSTSEKPA